MRIERIDLFHVRMPLIEPWRTAYGEDEAVESVLCRLVSGDLEAWGESSPLAAPCYSPEWAGGIFHTAAQWLAPAVLGQDIESGLQLQSCWEFFKGNSFAKAIIDTAWWSLESRRRNEPLHRVLGATRDAVAVGADFGVMDSVDQLLERIAEAQQQRFARVKLKYRPGWDLPMLTAVREQFPELTVHIDCNSGYSLADRDMFAAVDELGLAMIEQPLAHDDLSDHADLQKSLRTPICLDESVTRVRRVEQAIELGSCRYVNVKPGRVGGLTPAVQIHDVCQRAGIPCWVGGMLESGTGSAICAALAMLDNFVYPPDIFPSSRFYDSDLAAAPLELMTGIEGRPSVEAPRDIPAPDPQRLQAWTVQKATLQL